MVTATKLQAIVDDIRSFCHSHADEKQVQKYARYFTEGYDAYGISSELFMKQKDHYLETYHNKLTLNEAMKLGDLLLKSGKYEEASFAIHFVIPYQNDYSANTFQQLGRWLENGVRNWGHTDVMCSLLLEPFLTNEIVTMEAMADWKQSPSKWKRRAVPVCLIGLVKAGKNVKPMLKFIEELMMDDDRFVQQGVGWFLREVWKKDPKPVESMLLKWKDRAPRKIFQYATEKMSKEEKERYRRAKK